MTERVHTFLLAVIAVGVTVLAADGLVPTAHAETDGVVCDRYYFTVPNGLKAGTKSVDDFTVAVEGRIAGRLAEGKQVVFHGELPLMTGILAEQVVAGQAHVVCYGPRN